MLPFDLQEIERPRVLRLAESALANDARAITSATNPRSRGGPHDFSSEGDYWWPDPWDPDGPYVRRDGLTNPDNFVGHRQLMFAMADDVAALAAAFRITRDEHFAAAAVHHMRVWFVDSATRMNPDLRYAQSIRGVTSGRGTGIIDTVHLCEVALAIETLRESRALSGAYNEALTAWFRDYLAWMRTSPNGIEARDTPNNHATCWTLQASAFAHLTGNTRVLRDCRRRFKKVLLPRQMDHDGSFPRELARTKPFGYSMFHLSVMAALARLLSTRRENLVTYAGPDGRGVLLGIEFLLPYLVDKTTWPYPRDVMHWNDWPVRQPALLFGALAIGRKSWLELWHRLDPDPVVAEVRRNFPIRQPVLWMV
ncbi:MAG TPA: alginate lyase family protein [Gemmatimonadaceae bacterium]